MAMRFGKAGPIAVLSMALLASPAFAGKKNDTLTIAWDQPLDIADAYFNTSREGILAARMIWDQLIERDPDTFEYRAGLATAWRWVDELTLEPDLLHLVDHPPAPCLGRTRRPPRTPQG